MTRRGVKPFLFSHLDDGVDDMGWGRMAHRGVVTLEPSRVHMPSSQWELVSHRVSLEEMPHNLVSVEPGSGAVGASLGPGPTTCAGYQSRDDCICRAWPGLMQVTNHAPSDHFVRSVMTRI
jgi:hypothetical protein